MKPRDQVSYQLTQQRGKRGMVNFGRSQTANMGQLTNEFASIRYATLTLNKASTCRIQDQQLKQGIPNSPHTLHVHE